MYAWMYKNEYDILKIQKGFLQFRILNQTAKILDMKREPPPSKGSIFLERRNNENIRFP